MVKEESTDISISFLWCPAPYEVGWADHPADVPEWDTSRGCPLGVYKKHMGEWEIKDAPVQGYPRLVRRNLDGLITPRNRVNEDVINDLMKLVRYLEPAREGRQLKNLKNTVLKLAEKYGAPGRHDENTLEEWLRLAYYVNTYMWALHTLQRDGEDGFALLQQDILDRRATIHAKVRAKREGCTDVKLTGHVVRERHTIKVKTREDFIALADILDRVNAFVQEPDYRNVEVLDRPDEQDPVRAELVALAELLRYADKVEDDIEPGGRAKSLRLAVAKGLYNHFGRTVSAYQDSEGLQLFNIPTTEGIMLWVPLNIWTRFKLAEAWRLGTQVHTCPMCGTLFAPTHGNRKYCTRGTCAYKAHKKGRDTQADQGV